MSRNLSAVEKIEFDSSVKSAYQGTGLLRPTVRLKTNVTAKTCRFRRSGKGVATPRLPQTDVVPMNTTYASVDATLMDWNAPEYTDVFDQSHTDVQERDIVASNIASAIGRREDQMILDQLETANVTPNVDTNVGGATTGLNLAKLRATRKIFQKRGVPSTDRYFVMSADGGSSLLGTTEITSSDYNTVKTLTNGEINTFLGFKFIEIEDRDEGGLPLAGGLRTNYAYHKEAIGLAIGLEFRTEVNYIPEKTAWLANGIFAAGSAVIDPAGVIEVQTTEAA